MEAALLQYGGPLAVLAYLVYQSHFGAMRKLDQKICALVTVTRALARQTEGVDSDRVDQVLQKNGMNPQDFVEERAVAHHSRGTEHKFDLEMEDR